MLEVKLAALPADAWEAGHGGVAEAGVIIADDVGGAVEAPLLEGTEEVTPVSLGFAERGADAENGALAGGIDADRQQDGAIDHGSIAADLFITGIEDEIRVGNVVEWTLAPEFELFIELGGGAADLRGGDLQGASEFGEDGRDAAGGNALDVHLRNGEGERPLGALAALESGRVEVDFTADLRDIEGQFAETGFEGLGFETISVPFAGFGALVGSGAEHLGAFNLHGVIEQEAQ